MRVVFDKLKESNTLEAYVSMMKVAALRQDGKSQLGLARIQYETAGELKLDIDGNKVTLSIDIK